MAALTHEPGNKDNGVLGRKEGEKPRGSIEEWRHLILSEMLVQVREEVMDEP